AGLRRAGGRVGSAPVQPRRAGCGHPDLPGHLVAGGGADRPSALAGRDAGGRSRGRPGHRPRHTDPGHLPLPQHGPVRARRRGAAVPRPPPTDLIRAEDQVTRLGVPRSAPERNQRATRESGRAEHCATWLRHPVTAPAVLVVVLLAVTPALSTYWINVLTQTAIYSIVALGLGLLMGRVGLVSLGQIAVLALGAWV